MQFNITFKILIFSNLWHIFSSYVFIFLFFFCFFVTVSQYQSQQLIKIFKCQFNQIYLYYILILYAIVPLFLSYALSMFIMLPIVQNVVIIRKNKMKKKKGEKQKQNQNKNYSHYCHVIVLYFNNYNNSLWKKKKNIYLLFVI